VGITDPPRRAIAAVRRKRPAVDHLALAYGRYNEDNGGRLAASVTLPGFLAFFPLLAVAFAILGIVLHGNTDAQRSVLDKISSYAPGLLCGPGHRCSGSGQIDVSNIGKAAVGAGIIGALGLVLSGLAWIDALRQGLMALWHQGKPRESFVVRKGKDVVVLGALGLGLLASVAVAGVANSATSAILDALGAGGSAWAALLLRVVGIALSVGVDWALFVLIFAIPTGKAQPRRTVLRGALFGAVLLEVLTLVGGTYIKRTTGGHNAALYGTFAVIIGLLVWVNLVVRFALLAAAWTVTAPYDPDVPPSGSASSSVQPGASAIPVRVAPSALTVAIGAHGAPSAHRSDPAGTPGAPQAAGGVLHDERAARVVGRRAGRVGLAVSGVLGATAAAAALRTVRRLVER